MAYTSDSAKNKEFFARFEAFMAYNCIKFLSCDEPHLS
jgi:hypothetical protein